MAGQVRPTPAPSSPTPTPTATATHDTTANQDDHRAILKLKPAIARHARPPERTSKRPLATHIPRIESLTPSSDATIFLIHDGTIAPLSTSLSCAIGAHARVIDLPERGARIEHILHGLHAGLFDALRAFCRDTHAAGGRVLFVLNVGTANLDEPREAAKSRGTLAARDLDRFVCLVRAIASLAPGVRVLLTAQALRHGAHGGYSREATRKLRAAVALVHARVARELRLQNLYFAVSDYEQRRAPVSEDVTWTRAMKEAPGPEEMSCARVKETVEALLDDAVDAEVLRDIGVEFVELEETGKNGQNVESEKTCPRAPMRPAQDVYSRILYDVEAFCAQDFVIGYEDRHDGVLEIPLEQWRSETTDEDFVPMHRVRYFKHAREGILWDRRERFDRMFGSM